MFKILFHPQHKIWAAPFLREIKQPQRSTTHPDGPNAHSLGHKLFHSLELLVLGLDFFARDGVTQNVVVLGVDDHGANLAQLALTAHQEQRCVKERVVFPQVHFYLVPEEKRKKTVTQGFV